MQKLSLLAALFLWASVPLHAQLADGSIAPNFDLEDLNGNSHELYDYLDQGYSVVLDFSATWCGPCWNYHQTGILEYLWEEYGPDGTDQVMVFTIEADPNTSQQCIYGPAGCSGGSIGNWTTGITYPILNPPAAEASAINNAYNINYYPTLYGVAPNGKIYEVGQPSVSGWETWLLESFQLVFSEGIVMPEDCEVSNIDLNVVGGYGNVDIEWSTGDETEDLYGVTNGEYYVTLTDAHDFEAEIGPIEVDNPFVAELELVALYDLLCNDDYSGYIEVQMDGGSGDFHYEWSNGDDSPILEDIEAGSYELVVTDLVSGCVFEDEYYVDEPGDLEIFYDIENAPCDGSGPGAIDFDIEGGTFPFTFQFDEFESQNSFIYVEPGDYSVTVLDGNGCEAYTDLTVGLDDAPVAMASATGIFDCQTDTVFISAANSSSGPGITYNWYDPSGLFMGTGEQLQVDSAGLYTLVVESGSTDCDATSQVAVMQDTLMPVAMIDIMSSIDCNNATVTISGAGSTSDTTVIYAWTSPDGMILSDTSLLDITAGAPGTYQLTVMDTISGCEVSASGVVLEYDTPVAELNGELAFCETGSTTICMEAGVDASTEWYVDGVLAGSSECISLSSESEVHAILTHNVTGCQDEVFASTSYLEQPDIEIMGPVSICEGSEAQLCVDLLPEESALWFLDGNLMGDASCISVDQQGQIEVVVENTASGCNTEQEAQLVVTEPTEIQGSVSGMIDCQTTSVVLSVSLSDPASDVSWTDENNIIIATGTEVTVMDPGMYTATAITSEGCESMIDLEVQADIDDLPVAGFDYQRNDLEVSFDDLSQGTITERLWDFGDGNMSTEENPTHVYTSAGYYTVCLTTINDCGEDNSCVEVLAKQAMQVSSVVSNISCHDASDGVIQVNIFGGLAPFDVSWNGPDGSFTGNPAVDLSTGSYTVSVTDAAGEVITENYELSSPSPIELNSLVTHTSNGLSNGSILLEEITGGNGNYSILWDTGASSEILEDLAAGTYCVTVTDGKGCVHDQCFEVEASTSVNEISNLSEIKVYPVPAGKHLWIELTFEVKSNALMTIRNLVGQEMYRETVIAKDYRTAVALEGYSEGVYLLEVVQDGKRAVEKIIIAR